MARDKGRDLKTSELAKLFGHDPKTIVNWTCRPEAPLPSYRTPGRQYRFNPAEVVAWCERHAFRCPDGLRALAPPTRAAAA
jgi:phage terminase Nu1 subunit (DNA packaging protein)